MVKKSDFSGQRRDVRWKPVCCSFAIISLILASVVRLCIWSAFIDRDDTFMRPDTQSYLKAGIQLLEHGQFPSYSRTPVYPLFLAVASKTLSSDPAILVLVQIGVSLATILLMYLLSLRFFDARISLLVSLFMALDLTSAFSANHLLTETLFTLLLTVCVWGIGYFGTKEGANRWSHATTLLVSGIGLSVLSLCRPIAFLLFVPMVWWVYVFGRKNGRHKLALLFCFIACSALLPVSWIMRNHAQTGVFFLSTIPSTNLYEYRAAWNVARLGNRPFYAVQNEFRKNVEIKQQTEDLNEGELAQWMQSEGIRILKENPRLTMYQGVDGMLKMYLGISSADINRLIASDNQKSLMSAHSLLMQRLGGLTGSGQPIWLAGVKIWAMFYLVLLYVGVVVAFSQLVRHRLLPEQRKVLWLMLIVIAYFTFFSIGAETNSRFRVPVAPALSVLASVGWIAILDFIHRHVFVSNAIYPPGQSSYKACD